MAVRVLVCSVVLGALAAPAVADPGFVWQAPAGCPAADDVLARVAQRLGGSAAGLVHGVEIAIAREGAGFTATIDLRGVTVANDIRTLRAGSCEALADAIAMIVARVTSEARASARARAEGIDSTIATLGQAADRGADPPGDQSADDDAITSGRVRVATADVETHREVVVRDAVPPQHRWGAGLRALGLSGIGAQPGVAVGLELAGFVRKDRYFVELAHASWPASTQLLHRGAPGGVIVAMSVTSLRGGWSPELVPLRAWLGVEVGSVQGGGISLEDPRMGSGRWTAADGGFGVAWPMAPWARLVGSIEVAVPFERAQFLLTDGVEVYRPALASVRCAFGLELIVK